MYRAAVRCSPRLPLPRLAQATVRAAPRRFASTASLADQPRSWKSSVVRWAFALGAVYYYNTSPIFSEDSEAPQPLPAPPAFAESDLPTVDIMIEQKRRQHQAQEAIANANGVKDSETPTPQLEKPSRSPQGSPQAPDGNQPDKAALSPQSSPEAAEEEEESQEGAFNPETGEINWDCPCLGGMAHGPCGEEFKSAFSCFVYSEVEPKGVDCVEKFQHMQDCFKKYPDVYGAELADDDMPQDNDAPPTDGVINEDYQKLPQDSPPDTKDNNEPITPKQPSLDKTNKKPILSS